MSNLALKSNQKLSKIYRYPHAGAGMRGSVVGFHGCRLKGDFFLRTEGRFLLVFLALWFFNMITMFY